MAKAEKKPYIREKIPEDRAGWLEQRQFGIGGSDAAAALGMNPYKSKYTLFAEKSGMLTDEQEDNEAMRIGRDLEEYVARRFCEATGKKVKRSAYSYVSREYPFMRANLDRTVVGEEAGLECKTASALTRTKYDRGDIPIQYYLQCLHYMAVTGWKKWYIAILVMGKGFYWYEVNRDEAEIKVLIDNERAFWDLVQSGTPPVPDGSENTAETIYKLYPNAVDGATADLEDMESKLERRKELAGLIADLKDEKEQIDNELKDHLEDCEVGFSEKYVVSWKNTETSRVDTKLFKKEYPEIYASVLKTTSGRRFSVKERK